MLNVRVSDVWDVPSHVDETQFAEIVKKKNVGSNRDFLQIFSCATLKAVTTAEKLDHVEAHKFRESFVEAFSEAGLASFVQLVEIGLKPSEAVRARLLSVKRKNIFFEQ